jgi:hypothetical protein
MGKTITALPNQSIPDIVHMAYGTLEALMFFCRANNISATDVPPVGTVFTVPGEVDSVAVPIDEDILTYLGQNGVVIGTAALPPPPPLSLMVVLKPDIEVFCDEPTAPTSLGYYSFELRGTGDFINVYDLEEEWPGENKVRHQNINGMIAGTPPFEMEVPLSLPPMPDKMIPYHLAWNASMGFAYRFVWNPPPALVKTVTFRDIEGNEAYISPVFAFDTAFAAQACIQYAVGNISAEVITATDTVATLRVFRSHPPIIWGGGVGVPPDTFLVTGQEWLGDAIGGIPDPDDPGNPDKVIITVPAGRYTVGVKTNYKWTDSSTPPGGVAFPSSFRTMVIEVS